MRESEIKVLISQGEGLRVEFKQCKTALSKEVYETVCAFLNRLGGELLLGVSDDGEVTGIDPEYIDQIKKDFTASINNPQKISPAFYLTMDEIAIDGKAILYIYVPESSQVHRCSGKIFDRNEDGDFNITENNSLVSALFLRKQATYSENTIYPYAELADLRADIIARVRKQASLQREDHPWGSMNDFDLLKSAQLYKKDFQTGKDGYTLAGILLFGKDETILSVVPHFRIDAILRRENVDRYDDRDDIRTNLIESYDRLLSFGEKHLNDPFYLENDQRISLRGKILREVISNLLIHREYTNAFPAKFIIEKEKIQTENGNKPHGFGLINPERLTPFPKNPSIARVFKEIGRADELGSGTRNLFKYCRAYCGNDPQLLEEDIFRFVLPLTPQATQQVTPQATQQDEKRTKIILEFCKTPKDRGEIQKLLGLKDREYFRSEVLKPLLEQGLLHPTIPDKLTSPKQRYYSVKQGDAKK
ncbi:putative DNA binding domain-containing protein [Patescibacteria group bacterium]|nr:putative DNA binding domain-containing protein [Patescibacteria group bacterium]